MTPEALYLDLMKKCLTYYLWGDTLVPLGEEWGRSWTLQNDRWMPVRDEARESRFTRLLLRGVAAALEKRGYQIARRRVFDRRAREEGLDWPQRAHTMVGLKRLDSLQACIEDVIQKNVPGDLIETGVWRGGATIFMRAVLKAYGVHDRRVWVADSFEGLPAPDTSTYPADRGCSLHRMGFLRVSLEDVQANFASYGLLDEQVAFLKGWFRDTLPGAPVTRLAVLRLDGDMYESTMDALISLYARVSPGGYVIVDDYFHPACKQAVGDFRNRHGVTEPIQAIDRQSALWQRAPEAAVGNATWTRPAHESALPKPAAVTAGPSAATVRF